MQLGEGCGEVENDHLLIEAFKHVYALRTEMGDPDFTNNTALDDAIDSQAFAVMLAETVQVSSACNFQILTKLTQADLDLS